MSLDAFSDPVWDAIKTHLQANWTATPLAFPGEYFDPDESGSFVYVELLRSVYGQQTIGAGAGNRWDEEGVLWLRLNVPIGIDITKIGGATRALADLFRGVLLMADSLEFIDATIETGDRVNSNGEMVPDGNWFCQSVVLDWRHMDA